MTGSYGQQQRLCGWSRMVVKQFQDGRRLPFWKLIYRHISVNGGLSRLHYADEDAVSWLTNYGKWHAYEKKKKWQIIRFRWNFVHSSRFLTGWTPHDQKWKVALDRLRVRRTHFLVFYASVRPDCQAEEVLCSQPVRLFVCPLPNLWTQYCENWQQIHRHRCNSVRRTWSVVWRLCQRPCFKHF